MPVPITQLDDRRFDDLVAEARQRLVSQLPELQHIAEGDPLFALTDLMAWMTETIIYRANLIPERQRQAFLNLLQIPMRPAIPARGLVSIHSTLKTANFPALLDSETKLSAGPVIFTTEGEVQPTPLGLRLMIKEHIAATELERMGISQAGLRELYGMKTKAFRPRSFNLGSDIPTLSKSQDQRFYVLLHLNDKKLIPLREKIRERLNGKIINIGLAPLVDQPGDLARKLPPRQLKWHLVWQKSAGDKQAQYLPLEVLGDTSDGCRKTGVVRIKIPKNFTSVKSEFTRDAKFAGINNTPPEAPVDVDPDSVLCWLALTAPGEEHFQLGFMAVNAVTVAAQEIFRDQVIGVGDGRSGQVAHLKAAHVDVDSLQIEVSEQGVYVPWRRVEHFAGMGINDRVFSFDAAAGTVVFGDGIRGMRPAPQSRIRAAYYRAGGGSGGNLPANTIKQLLSANASQLELQHHWPTSGGVDAETVAQAEKRIPTELNHRNRAVTRQDFIQLAQENPLAPVARAEVIPGLLPGNYLDAVRSNVPGVVSIFVLPPAEPAFAAAPRPTAGMLSDLYQYLDERKMLATEHYVLSPQFIPVAISLSIEVLDNEILLETFRAVEQHILLNLWALPPGGYTGTGWPMGRELDTNELKTIAARAPGVLAVNQLRLYYQNREGQWTEVQQKLRLQAFQLPELMAVQVEEGEQLPIAPDLVSAPIEDDAVAVPVIPDFC